MTGHFWLDWAILAVSLFNTILLLWLGLTVLLNADRRHWGVWLMGGGLLAGALFFISHTAILGQELALNLDGLNFWWRAGWFPVTVSPFAWYVAVLWYGGFWAEPRTRLAARHQHWLWLMSLWLAGLIALMLVANPIPAYDQLVQLDLSGTLAVRNIPLLFLLFPLWMVTCILLSIDVLHRPAQAEHPNTAVARRRSRPWLFGTAGALLAVSLLVAYFIVSMIATVAEGRLPAVQLQTIALYDLALSLLIAIASLLLGQAIVSYEIFTGRVLPRRSFVRHWRNAMILAGGYAAVIGWSLVMHLRPIYSLLLATLLMALFYALYSWRTFWEQEQFVARLRPFVQSQGIRSNTAQANSTAAELLAAICRDVLGTAQARLIPLGSMAALSVPALTYPAHADGQQLRPPHHLDAGMTPLDPTTFAPYRWAISLWDERGQIGALLIGEKEDGGLYSQEEMETAQATGARIVHLLAGEQMMRRLMELQRKRTTEQRVMDLRARRMLHDEILPTLHLTLLQLGGTAPQSPAVQEAMHTLAEAHRQIASLLTNTQPASARAPDPCDLVAGLRALVDAEFAHNFESIRWSHADSMPVTVHADAVTGEVILGAAREVIRNAAFHGRGGNPDTPLCLEIGLCVQEGELTLSIQDNGVGMDAGAAGAASGGSGSGLALHSTLLAMVGGYLTVEPMADGGTVVRIAVMILPSEKTLFEQTF
jgi:signal transduction histidine kinase